jgi:hypothetical protein
MSFFITLPLVGKIEVQYIAVIIFMVVFATVTNWAKSKIDMKPLYLSWIVGGVLFFLARAMSWSKVSIASVTVYMAAMLIVNAGWKCTTFTHDWMASKFTFIKPRSKK